MSLAPGTRLGAYEITAPIGAGGMGEVYRAHDARLGRDVAIKVLPEAFSADPERLQRFEQEARAAAALNHPNILAVHDIGQENGSPFIVSELLEGETLRELLTTGARPIRKAVEYAVQVARGLAAAHDKGIVHRDLKPENIFITSDGRVKILDFGLAKLVEPKSAVAASMLPTTPGATQPGMVLGTIGYMAPEQARGLAADYRADLFAFGAILYEMLSGARAFHGETTADTMTAILKEDPPDLPIVNRHIPPSLARIVSRCLEKSPGARFQSTSDLAFALEAAIDGSGSRASATGPAEVGPHEDAATVPAKAGTHSTRRNLLPWAVAAITSVVAAVLLGLLVSRPREATNDRPVRLSLAAPLGTVIVSGSVPELSPNGQQVAMVARDAAGVEALWVRTLDNLDARRLPGTENARAPFWSPDGRSLGFFAAGKMKRIDIESGLPQTLGDVAVAQGAAWGPGGTILFSAFPEGLMRIPASGGAAAVLTTLDRSRQESGHFWPQFLPGGQFLLFYQTGSDSKGTHLGSASDAQHHLIWPTTSHGAYSAGYLLAVREGTLMARAFDVRTGQVGDTDAGTIATRVAVDSEFRRGLFSASENGRLVYADASWAESRLVRMTRSGVELGTVGPVSQSARFNLSRDGSQIVHERPDAQDMTRNLWTVAVDGGQSTRMTSDNVSKMFPVWSPNRDRTVYEWFKEGPGDLYMRPSNGGGEAVLLYRSMDAKSPSDWSADGARVAFNVTRTDAARGTNFDLWLLPVGEPAKAAPFKQTRFNEYDGHFSPNGGWLAYESDESGSYEIYVAALPDGERRQISTGGGTQPAWRHDGNELFYVAPDNTIMSVELPSGDPLKHGAPKPLFKAPFNQKISAPTAQYAVMPDGQSFILRLPVEHPAPFTVILNWPALLRK